MTALSFFIVTVTVFAGTPVVALNPPAAALIASRLAFEIMTHGIVMDEFSAITIGSAVGLLKLSTITAIAPEAWARPHLVAKPTPPPRSINTIFPVSGA